ncbi:MAG: hypothetical protein ACYSTR_05480, partial [Planctomycetota bacterium]
MSAKTLSGTTTLVIVILAMFYISIPVQAADSDDALLNMLPEDCMFCLRINNFNESLGKMDQYLAGASPIPMSLAMMTNMQLGAIIGDPMLTGIDQGGDFAAFVLFPETEKAEPVRGILVPVNDYSEFVKTNPNCTVKEDGTTLLSSPNSPLGGLLLSPAGNKYALATIDDTFVAPLKKALTSESKMSNRLSSDQTKDAVSAPAWAYVNLAGLYEKYNQDALATLEMAQTKMGQTGGPAEMMAFQFKMLAEMFKEFADEADS